MAKICELKIQNYSYRESLISILACSGYKVSIEERQVGYWKNETDYYVIVETVDAEVEHG